MRKNYLEKHFQTDFNKWVKFNQMIGAFELKVSNTNSLPFSSVRDHQEQALSAVKRHFFVHKIADLGNQNPFDCFSLKDYPAFVVIMFNCKETKDFVMIDIDTWQEEKKTSKRKSLTLDRATLIGTVFSLK